MALKGGILLYIYICKKSAIRESPPGPHLHEDTVPIYEHRFLSACSAGSILKVLVHKHSAKVVATADIDSGWLPSRVETA